jgi:hypothetical protein
MSLETSCNLYHFVDVGQKKNTRLYSRAFKMQRFREVTVHLGYGM